MYAARSRPGHGPVTTVANTIFLHNLAPVMAFPLAWWMYRERLSASAMTGAAIAVFGVAMLSGVSLFQVSNYASSRFLLGAFLALGARCRDRRHSSYVGAEDGDSTPSSIRYTGPVQTRVPSWSESWVVSGVGEAEGGRWHEETGHPNGKLQPDPSDRLSHIGMPESRRSAQFSTDSAPTSG